MDVFTILNCGTNYDRTKKGEIVADFGANMEGKEHVNFLINEGPGGSAPGHLMPGTYDPYTLERTAKKSSPFWSKTPMKTLVDVTQGTKKYKPGGHGLLSSVLGIFKPATKAAITGHGWDDNIRHAIATLADRFPNLSATVNMIGWSRGAVTCLRIANWMKEFLGNAWTVNIFAIDPVAGIDAGTVLPDTRRIPDIVSHYVGIFAMDEARGDFRPQDLSRIEILNKNKTMVSFLPFPGVHSTLVVPDSNTLALPEVAKMVRYLAYRFLNGRGTKFKNPERPYAWPQICQMYAAMKIKSPAYSKLMEWGFMNKQSGGKVPRNVGNMGASISPFFVNEHHRLVFQFTYSDIYNYFFTHQIPNRSGPRLMRYKATDPMGQKFEQFYNADPDSFEALSQLFVLERTQTPGQLAVWEVSPPGLGAQPLSAAASAGLPLLATLV